MGILNNHYHHHHPEQSDALAPAPARSRSHCIGCPGEQIDCDLFGVPRSERAVGRRRRPVTAPANTDNIIIIIICAHEVWTHTHTQNTYTRAHMRRHAHPCAHAELHNNNTAERFAGPIRGFGPPCGQDISNTLRISDRNTSILAQAPFIRVHINRGHNRSTQPPKPQSQPPPPPQPHRKQVVDVRMGSASVANCWILHGFYAKTFLKCVRKLYSST